MLLKCRATETNCTVLFLLVHKYRRLNHRFLDPVGKASDVSTKARLRLIVTVWCGVRNLASLHYGSDMRGITLISTSSLQNSHVYTLSGSPPSPSLVPFAKKIKNKKCTLQCTQSSEEFCIRFLGGVEKLAGVGYSNSIMPRLKRWRRRFLLSSLSALPKAPDRAIKPIPHHSFPSVTA